MKLSVIEKSIMAIVFSGLIIAVFLPLMFFLTVSFSSDVEMSHFPKSFIPKFSVTVEIKYDTQKQMYEIFYDNGEGFESVLTSKDPKRIERLFRDQYGISKPGTELLKDFSKTIQTGTQQFTYRKNLAHNLTTFFSIVTNARNGFINSIITAIYTIVISLSIGSLAGYAIARYNFKFKDQINILLLIVRMFPVVGISIPLAVLLIDFGLFDSLIGLAIIYSIPNIALTAWITSSIFVGINKELEEASLVFGANPIQTFFKITLPMTLPALAASSMYAFLTAWNDTISALILTRSNQTLALVVYKAIGTNSSGIHYAAAGSLILIIPALIFTFIIRKYVGQMWGNVSL